MMTVTQSSARLTAIVYKAVKYSFLLKQMDDKTVLNCNQWMNLFPYLLIIFHGTYDEEVIYFRLFEVQ